MPSFDIVSRVDMQEMDNAVNQVKKEVATRYDFRGSSTLVELDRKEGKVRFLTEDEMKLQALRELLLAKAVRRGIDAKAFTFSKPERAGGDKMRQEVSVATGVPEDVARKIVKMVKDSRLKVQSSMQGDEVRVTGKNRDDLQAVISLVREAELDVPLQFVNMRE
ncbi:MAG: YajQ family cyclic di-GMP-binding protein [Gaiellales bacterium]|nr:YajQ family cyclic di-GMP-binding protein [Gaiellales bacterium]